MHYLRINKLSSKPLYRQLSESVERAIIKKELRDGDRLPSERDLCHVFDISSKVVRRAFDELARKGLTEGVPGKGTFVKLRIRIRTRLSDYYKVSEWLRTSGYEVRLNTTYISMIEFSPGAISPLMEYPEKQYLMVRRLYKVNQNPYLSRIIYIPKSRFPSENPIVDTNMDCLQLIEHVSNERVVRLEGTLHVFGPYSSEALFLELNEEDPIQFFLTALYDKNDELLAIMHSYFNGKLVEWSVKSDDELFI